MRALGNSFRKLFPTRKPLDSRRLAGEGRVEVCLRGRETAVAHQHLKGLQVDRHLHLEQARRKGVAEGVRGQALVDS